MSLKRGSLEIIKDILETAVGGSIKKTPLAHKSNLDTIMINNYLQLLMELDLVTYDENSSTYSITEKGHNYLEKYGKLLELTIMH